MDVDARWYEEFFGQDWLDLVALRIKAANETLDVEFGQCDMREIPFEDEFDAVINLFTAFGYFETEGEDRQVLAAVERALREGGAFLVDTIHPPWIYRPASTAPSWR